MASQLLEDASEDLDQRQIWELCRGLSYVGHAISGTPPPTTHSEHLYARSQWTESRSVRQTSDEHHLAKVMLRPDGAGIGSYVKSVNPVGRTAAAEYVNDSLLRPVPVLISASSGASEKVCGPVVDIPRQRIEPEDLCDTSAFEAPVADVVLLDVGPVPRIA